MIHGRPHPSIQEVRVRQRRYRPKPMEHQG